MKVNEKKASMASSLIRHALQIKHDESLLGDLMENGGLIQDIYESMAMARRSCRCWNYDTVLRARDEGMVQYNSGSYRITITKKGVREYRRVTTQRTREVLDALSEGTLSAH